MEITFTRLKDTLLIKLIGELDENASDYAKKTLDSLICDCDKRTAVIDLSRLSFMDSTGIGILIGRYKLAKSKGISLFVKNPSVTVDRIFVMSGLYEIMPCVN